MHITRDSALKGDWEKHPLPHWGVEPALAAAVPGTQPTELQPSSLPLPTVQCIYICTQFCWYSTNWATTLISAPAHSRVHIHLHTILLVLNQLSYNPHLCPCPQYSAYTSAHNSVGTQPTELQPSSLPLPTVQCMYICTQFCWTQVQPCDTKEQKTDKN